MQLAPNDFLSNWDLAWAYALQGKKGEALERLNKEIYPIDGPIVLVTFPYRIRSWSD